MSNEAVHTLIISKRAQKEIEEAWTWYEERQYGLGDRFYKEVVSKLRQIQGTPDRFPKKFRSYREAKVAVFPFIIIYRTNKKADIVRVVAVFHTSLNPKKKYR